MPYPESDAVPQLSSLEANDYLDIKSLDHLDITAEPRKKPKDKQQNTVGLLLSRSSRNFFATVANNLQQLKPLAIGITITAVIDHSFADTCGCGAPPMYVPLPLTICFQDSSESFFQLDLNTTAINAFNNLQSAVVNCGFTVLDFCDESLYRGYLQYWFADQNSSNDILAELTYRCTSTWQQCSHAALDCLSTQVNNTIYHQTSKPTHMPSPPINTTKALFYMLGFGLVGVFVLLLILRRACRVTNEEAAAARAEQGPLVEEGKQPTSYSGQNQASHHAFYQKAKDKTAAQQSPPDQSNPIIDDEARREIFDL